jgi:hypothetical protein
MTLNIDANIPVPKAQPRCKPLYPWLEMREGDSFTVDNLVQVASARGSFYRYRKLGLLSAKLVMVSRKEGEHFRCWLVAAPKKNRKAA